MKALWTLLVAGAIGLDPPAQPTAESSCPPLEVYRLAYVSNAAGSYDLYTARGDGGEVRRLVDWPSQEFGPRLSPDGSRIAFVSDRDGDFEIYAVDAGGGTPVQLTRNTVADWNPDWSPDGTRLAWDSAGDLWTMRADGSAARPLAPTPSADANPVWSPDGGWLAFVSNRDGAEGLNTEVYVMRADGSGVRRLTTNKNRESVLSWARDGRSVVFTRHPWYLRPDDVVAGSDDIAIVSVDGGEPQTLAPHAASDEHPYVLADGCGLLFDSDRDGNRGLWFLRPGAAQPARLGGPGLTGLWASMVRRPPPAPEAR